MRAFITGAMGFIGQHLVRRLKADGYELVIYDRKPAPAEGEAIYVQGDVLDAPSLTSAMEFTKPDIVFHLAALADVSRALKQPTEQLHQNFLATSYVLDAMRAAGVLRLVFTSSAVVYGDHPLCEDDSPRIHIPENGWHFPKQTSIYGAMKLASESLISAYCAGYGMSADIFRLVSLVGEGYRHGNIVDFFKRLSADPTRLELLGSPTQKKYYCYVGDCISAMMLTVDHPHEGAELWNVSHHEPNTIQDSIDAVSGLLNIAPDIVPNGKPWVGDLPTLVLDCSKLRAIGWEPRIPIREGMRRTVRDLIGRQL